jgi:hypothetical protein
MEIDKCFALFCSPSLFYLPVHSRCQCCLFWLDHIQTHTTVGRTPLDEGSARRRDLYLTTQTLYKTKTSMPPGGFEPTIPASARPQTLRLRTRGHWDQPLKILHGNFLLISRDLLDLYSAPPFHTHLNAEHLMICWWIMYKSHWLY